MLPPEVDAYLVTYAINDRTSYHHAMDILFSLRQQPLGDAVVIMVANKSDLVRLREVAEQGIRNYAQRKMIPMYIACTTTIVLAIWDLISRVM